MKNTIRKSFLVLLVILGVRDLIGQIDNSFGFGGTHTLNFASNLGGEKITCSKLVGTDLLVAGEAAFSDGSVGAFIVKYDANGNRDMTFGTGGLIMKKNYGGFDRYIIRDIEVDASGRIVAAGEYKSGSISNGFIMTYDLVNGLVSNFHSPIIGRNSGYHRVHITSGQNIVATGYTIDLAGSRAQALISKFQAAKPEWADSTFYGIGHFIDNDIDSSRITASTLYDDTLVVGGFLGRAGRDSVFVRRFVVEGGLGQEDPSFNKGISKYSLPSVGQDAIPAGMVVLPNKSIVMTINGGTPGNYICHMIRMNKSGGRNSGFGGSGFVAITYGIDDEVRDLILTSDNRLLLAGRSKQSAAENDLYVGAYDTLGGVINQRVFNVSGIEEGAYSVVEGATGYIYVSGYTKSFNDDALIAAVNSNADNIGTFGSGGFLVDYYLFGDEEPTSIKVDPNGRLLITGLTAVSSGQQVASIIRLSTAGFLDPFFGTDGRNYYWEIEKAIYTSSALDGSGNIFTAGIYEDSLKKLIVGRYFSNGVEDIGFGISGVVKHAIPLLEDVYDIHILPSGKMLVSAFVNVADSSRPAVIQLNINGSIDTNFGVGGMYVSSVTSDDFPFLRMRVQNDGKILLGIAAGTDGHDFACERILQDGTPDPNFGSNGRFKLDAGADDYVTAIDFDASGNVYLAGVMDSSGAYYQMVLKITPVGNLDATFGTGGIVRPQVSVDNLPLGIYYTGTSLLLAGTASNSAMMVSLDMQGQFNTGFDGDGILLGTSMPSNNSAVSTTYSNGALYFLSPEEILGKDIRITKYLYSTTSTADQEAGLSVPGVNKVYGDAPFSVTATSASPAPIAYSVVSGCLTYDTITHKFSITCAGEAVIAASQPLMAPYKSGYDTATVYIAKATPTLVFNAQGAVFDDPDFQLIYSTNSDATEPSFTSATTSAFTISSGGILTPQAEGSALVTCVIPPTNNYLSVSASATITIYLVPVPPEATPVLVSASVGDTSKINLLNFAIGKSSPLNPKKIDLDPEQDGIQSKYASPAFGFFSVDTNGFLTFIPVYGFQGEATISYTVQDNRGITSDPAVLKFVYTLPNPEIIPELETKEVFTPNGDGFNDAFVIAFLDNTIKNTFIVYDRNGHEVFRQDEYQNNWVGQDASGNNLDSGMYYYHFNDELNRSVKGVFLIRR